GEVLDNQIAYWSEQLRGVPALDLPIDYPRQENATARAATCDLAFSTELSTSLKELSRAQNTTLFMTLMSAFQTLLHRYSGQDDICVGSGVAGRTHQETEGLIGFFINALALRVD